MTVAIREADKEADFPAIFAGAGAFVQHVNRPEIFPAADSETLAAVVGNMLSLPGVVVLLAVDGERVVGGIGFLISTFIWNPEHISSEELFWWCDPAAPASASMALLRAARAVGIDAGASIFAFHSLMTSPKGVDLAYRRMGATPIQVTYMGAL